ncbi:RimK/LysX family protein [Vibrio sinaloensis]|nr:RimK/LysX family protein [Vibrio sinaloensis]
MDTGARTSCLHAFKVESFKKRTKLCGSASGFTQKQHDTDFETVCEAKVIDERIVRDSGGHEESRYVIESELSLGGKKVGQ